MLCSTVYNLNDGPFWVNAAMWTPHSVAIAMCGVTPFDLQLSSFFPLSHCHFPSQALLMKVCQQTQYNQMFLINFPIIRIRK